MKSSKYCPTCDKFIHDCIPTDAIEYAKIHGSNFFNILCLNCKTKLRIHLKNIVHVNTVERGFFLDEDLDYK